MSVQRLARSLKAKRKNPSLEEPKDDERVKYVLLGAVSSLFVALAIASAQFLLIVGPNDLAVIQLQLEKTSSLVALHGARNQDLLTTLDEVSKKAESDTNLIYASLSKSGRLLSPLQVSKIQEALSDDYLLEAKLTSASEFTLPNSVRESGKHLVANQIGLLRNLSAGPRIDSSWATKFQAQFEEYRQSHEEFNAEVRSEHVSLDLYNINAKADIDTKGLKVKEIDRKINLSGGFLLFLLVIVLIWFIK